MIDNNKLGVPGAKRPHMSSLPSEMSIEGRLDKVQSDEDVLVSVFSLDDMDTLVAKYPCYLVRLVTLPGWLYVTQRNICFYAPLPDLEQLVCRAGYVSKKNHRTSPLTHRYYMVLQRGVLSWYDTAENQYEPLGSLLLDDVLAVRKSRSRKHGFKLITAQQKHLFIADSDVSRKEWVDDLQRSMFMAKHQGSAVRIVLPFSQIRRLSKSRAFEVMEYIKVSICDDDQDHTDDNDYFFAFFPDFCKAYETIEAGFKRGQSPGSSTSSRSSSSRASGDSWESQMDVADPISMLSELSANLLDSEKGRPRSASLRALKHYATLPFQMHKQDQDTPPSVHSMHLTTDISDQKVHKHFPMLPKDETVHAVFRASVWRLLPYYGHLYLTTGYVCFYSGVLAGRQKIMVPFCDIITIRPLKSRGYYLLHGLALLFKDMDDEIYFEFSSIDQRDQFYNLLCVECKQQAQHSHSSSDSDSDDAAAVASDHVPPPTNYKGPPILQTHEKHGRRPWHRGRPLTITCLTIGSRGDVQPFIALCQQLQKDGQKCRIASHSEYRAWVERYGIEFRSVGGDPGALMKLCIDHGFLSYSFIKSGVKFFYNWFETLLETSWEACQGTDVLIESPSAMVGVHIAEKLEIPYFRSMPFPWTRTTKFPHPFAMQNLAGTPVYNDMTYTLIDTALWTGTSKAINRFRRERLGLPATTLDRLEMWRVPHLYSFSPRVLPVPKDWPDYVHATGYWFTDDTAMADADQWRPPHTLRAFLHASAKPIVYIGFGSILVPDPLAMTRVIVDAIVDAGVKAIICKGWSARVPDDQKSTSDHDAQQQQCTELLEMYPNLIYTIDAVPHDWLFPQVQAVIHHGGAGTTAAGLRAGKPTIIKPFFGDQRFWGQRVEELQVGICMAKLTKAKLTEHLRTVTRQTTMIERAKRLGEAIRAENGPKQAVACLFRDMAIARRTTTAAPAADADAADAPPQDNASTSSTTDAPAPTRTNLTQVLSFPADLLSLYSNVTKWKPSHFLEK
ncbi:hypothetical protein BC940DRAFT_288215 [Gongronella butleri]|nr:hypothetical protein BC940DRAFT_288215 [Gongronella butleri]